MAKLKVEYRQRQLDYSRGSAKEYWSNARVYFFVKDESVLEHFENRRNRPVTVYRKMMAEVLKQSGLPEDTKYKWRQNAGCSCGCSPGFIIDGMSKFDVFVTVHPDDK